MRAAGEGVKAHPGGVSFAFQHGPFGLRGAAVFMVEALARLVLPIGGEGQVDEAGILLHDPGNARDIGLGGLAVLEL